MPFRSIGFFGRGGGAFLGMAVVLVDGAVGAVANDAVDEVGYKVCPSIGFRIVGPSSSSELEKSSKFSSCCGFLFGNGLCSEGATGRRGGTDDRLGEPPVC